MSSPNYTQEKFWQAVHALVTIDAPLRDRLREAGSVLNRLHNVGRLEERAFPRHPELQRRFDDLMQTLTTAPGPVGDEGTLTAATRAFDEMTARRVAEEIFSLFGDATDLADTPVGFKSRR